LSFAFETRKLVSPKWGLSATNSTIPNPGPWRHHFCVTLRQFRKIPQLTLLRKDSKACFNASWKSCRRCNKSWLSDWATPQLGCNRDLVTSRREVVN
jgi:hypothetical protein